MGFRNWGERSDSKSDSGDNVIFDSLFMHFGAHTVESHLGHSFVTLMIWVAIPHAPDRPESPIEFQSHKGNEDLLTENFLFQGEGEGEIFLDIENPLFHKLGLSGAFLWRGNPKIRGFKTSKMACTPQCSQNFLAPLAVMTVGIMRDILNFCNKNSYFRLSCRLCQRVALFTPMVILPNLVYHYLRQLSHPQDFLESCFCRPPPSGETPGFTFVWGCLISSFRPTLSQFNLPLGTKTLPN